MSYKMYKPADRFFQRIMERVSTGPKTRNDAVDFTMHLKPNGKWLLKNKSISKYSIQQSFSIPHIDMFMRIPGITTKDIYILSHLNPFEWDSFKFYNIKEVINDYTLYIIPDLSIVAKKTRHTPFTIADFVKRRCAEILKDILVEYKHDILHVYYRPYDTVPIPEYSSEDIDKYVKKRKKPFSELENESENGLRLSNGQRYYGVSYIRYYTIARVLYGIPHGTTRIYDGNPYLTDGTNIFRVRGREQLLVLINPIDPRRNHTLSDINRDIANHLTHDEDEDD